MSNLVPDGWTLTSIGEITNSESLFKDGDWVESKDQDPSGNNRLIQLADVGDGRFINKSSRFMNDEQFTRLKCTELKKGDVLVARMPEPLGRACIYPLNNTKAATIVDIAIIRTKNADHYWLMSAINSSDFRYHIDLNASGTTRTRIARGALSKLKLIAPPLPEQQKIAKILTSVDEVIEKTQAQINKLKDLKTGMMQELLTNGIGHTEFKDSPVGRIPAEWEVKTVESVLSAIIDYRGKAPPKSEIGVPLITAKNMRNGFINQEPREYIFEEQFDSWMVRGMPLSGDVFITTEAPLGNVAKVPNYKFAIGQRVLTLRPNELICTEFLLFILQSEKFKKELDLQSTGSTVAGIKQSTFRKVLLPVPPVDEQMKISENLNSIVSRSDVIQDKLRNVKSLKKALMQDLLTGNVRVKL